MISRPSLPSAALSCRVFGLVLSPRWGGQAVVDGFGIAPVPRTRAEVTDPTRRTSFRTIPLRARESLERQSHVLDGHLALALARHRPTIAVLGVHRNETRAHRDLRAYAKAYLVREGIPVVERDLLEARRLFLGRIRGAVRQELPERLSETFFPELRARLPPDAERARYERHAWNALALAVALLAEYRPLSVVALAQPWTTLSPTLHELLTRAANDLHPSAL